LIGEEIKESLGIEANWATCDFDGNYHTCPFSKNEISYIVAHNPSV